MKETIEFNFKMSTLNDRPRVVRVFQSATDTNKPLPVIYMHDGQNLFYDEEATYKRSWRIAELFKTNRIEVIVVGIDSAEGLSRLDELSPFKNETLQHRVEFIDRVVGGEGDAYLDFIVNEVKPFIDQRFNTLTDPLHTMIAGSSMGGVMSLYALLKRPDVFRKAACLSNAFWFCEDELIDLISSSTLPTDLQVYLDFGTQESEEYLINEAYINTNKRIFAALKDQGVKHLDLEIIEGGIHHESSWDSRFVTIVKNLIK